MRQLAFLILLLIFNHGFIKAQGETDSTEYLIDKLINKVNELTRTNESGQGDFKFQSQYSIDWNKKSKTLTLGENPAHFHRVLYCKKKNGKNFNPGIANGVRKDCVPGTI